MEELIKQAFLHVDVIGPHVMEGHYDLLGPNGEIILPGVWEVLLKPGWSICMHMWPMKPKHPQHLESLYPAVTSIRVPEAGMMALIMVEVLHLALHLPVHLITE